MALYKYFKRGPVLPTIRMCGEQANTEALGESSREPTEKQTVKLLGKYKLRARVGKCATENSSTKAARYFLKFLDWKIT